MIDRRRIHALSRTRRKTVPGPVGFTQIELLVSIAIIALLISLYLPMIGRARESARGAQCKDNLHNLILAAHNYEATFATYPAGAIAAWRPIRNVPGGDGIGWTALLLDFLEQRPLRERIDFTQPLDADDLEPLNSTISIYICPASGNDAANLPPGASYAGSHHQLEAPIDIDNHGALVLNRGLRVMDFPDGFTHTLFIGEKEIAADDLGWWSGSRATLRNTGTPLARIAPATAATAPPPVDPLRVGGFASGHVWGVQFALGDSSVRLLSFDTDLAVLQRMADRADGELRVDPNSRSRAELDHGRRVSTFTSR